MTTSHRLIKRSVVCMVVCVVGCSSGGSANNAAGASGTTGSGGGTDDSGTPAGSGTVTGSGSGGAGGGSGSGGGAGGGSGVRATTREEFIADFDDIICGPTGNMSAGAIAMACAISNDAAVNLYDCMFRRADFGNMGKMDGLSSDLRTLLTTPGGPSEFCPHIDHLDVPGGFTCRSWSNTVFGGGCINLFNPDAGPCSWHGNIWDNSDPKPESADLLLTTCKIH